ncbi:unnamed protein product [Lactuca virosa]|uniref:Uncharacterized protein n=1 Tax=Lactuca virosa TaxID=75947 RepID=A0AAU9NJF2_9ASTR|nr:unnamed protein product [Lactuca virosa]
MVVPRGTAAPILLKWFVSRDVPTGAPSSNESFCGVLRLLFFRTFFSLPRDRSAKRERARRRKGQRLQPNGNEQGRNDKMRRPGHPHLERRAEVFGPVALPVPPESGGCLCGGLRHQKSGLKLSPYQRADS